MSTASRNIEALERRRDYLRRTATNDSQKQELSATIWAIEKLTALVASAKDERVGPNERNTGSS